MLKMIDWIADSQLVECKGLGVIFMLILPVVIVILMYIESGIIDLTRLAIGLLVGTILAILFVTGLIIVLEGD